MNAITTTENFCSSWSLRFTPGDWLLNLFSLLRLTVVIPQEGLLFLLPFLVFSSNSEFFVPSKKQCPSSLRFRMCVDDDDLLETHRARMAMAAYAHETRTEQTIFPPLLSFLVPRLTHDLKLTLPPLPIAG